MKINHEETKNTKKDQKNPSCYFQNVTAVILVFLALTNKLAR
jgi:succinate dehydrogenase hydrophobic anchor subunit